MSFSPGWVQVYREYRNALVNKYRENVEHYFSVSDANKFVTGDVTGVSRVWEFLDKWGLINFQAKDGPPRAETSGRTLFEISPAGASRTTPFPARAGLHACVHVSVFMEAVQDI